MRYRLPDIPPRSPGWLQEAHNEAFELVLLIGEIGDDTCIYCGEPADHADHLVPRPISGEEWRRYVPTVPACQSCNSTLGAFPSPVITSRAHYIAHRIALTNNLDRIRQDLGAGRWADDDEFERWSSISHRHLIALDGGWLAAVRQCHPLLTGWRPGMEVIV